MAEERGIRIGLKTTVKNCSSSRNGGFLNKQICERRKRRDKQGSFISSLLFHAGILLFLVAIAEALDPPNIIPDRKTLTIEAGQSLKLTCNGDEPLVWNHTGEDLETNERVSITTSNGTGMARPYSSTLTMTDVSHTDVGYFTCTYAGMDENEDEVIDAMVYVFVQDEDHLLVLEKKTTFLFSKAGQALYLPCRPSWLGVDIKIFHEENVTHSIPLDDTNYSVEKGLSIPRVNIEDAGRYDCEGNFKGKSDLRTFIVHVIPPTEIIYSPVIKVTNGGSVAAGEKLEIVCFSEQKTGTYFSMDIGGPLSANDTRVEESTGAAFMYYGLKEDRPGWKSFFRKYEVKMAEKGDSGNYSCTVKILPNEGSSTRYKQIKVFDEGEALLDVSTDNESIVQGEYRHAKWAIYIKSFPLNFDFSWKLPDGGKVPYPSSKYNIKNTSRENEIVLEIYNVTLEDAGSYPFIVQLPGQDIEPRILNLSLTVKAAPKVAIGTNGPKSNFLANETYELRCEVKGYPLPKVSWTYAECSEELECNKSRKINELRQEPTKHGLTSIVEFTANRYGMYSCNAGNVGGKASDKITIRVVDFNGDSEMVIDVPEEIVEGDDVELTCFMAKLNNVRASLVWMREVDGKRRPLENDTMKSEETKWSWRKVLTLPNIQHSETGKYVCKNNGDRSIEESVYLNVSDISLPKLLDTTNLNNSKVSLKLGDTLKLTCSAEGKPRPKIIWTWEDHSTQDWPSDMKYQLMNDNTVLFLKYVPDDAQGRFMCKAQNRNGTASAFLDIAVTGTRTFSNLAVAIIIILFIAVIIFGVILARYKYKQGEMSRFLKEISQKDFYDGAVENINPDLSVTDQAYLLPFCARWEFPKDRLKLGMQLGSGAFGRVVKADACGILDTEPITTVAVKMVKPNADESHFKALMSELKIMVHLGKHINVVNILGACTKNLAKKKELFVIVEYCKYGSLLSYMHRHRRTFINQLDPARGFIDPTIDRTDRNSEQSQMPRIHYAQLTFTDPGNSRKPASNGYRTLDEFNQPIVDDPPTPTLRPHPLEPGPRENGHALHSPVDFLTPNPHRRSTEHYVAESQAESACTGFSYLSNGHTMTTTGGTTKRRSSCGSQWQDHYRGDYQAREVKPIRTTDLLCWAFQIARGMEYLASRKVLHGDLAARNVLLAENNVVKICDFGLAKEMYKDYKYKKKSEGVLLPVKWMAIESIYYGVFSTHSDAWSYGVVLWELFTLGKTPYPGMEADDRFYKRISEGYRMEKPPLAPSCVYDIMLECWSQEPTERPSFPALVDRIGDMMEEGLRNHYVDLNTAYMKINHSDMAGRPDYLLQMGRSEFASNSVRPTPERQYQNLPEEQDSAGYLKPITLSAASLSERHGAGPTYQNVSQPPLEPSGSLLANNSGYMFVKAPPPSEIQTIPSEEDNDPNPAPPSYTVQIRYSPDIKDMFGLREDSTSPDNYCLEPAVDENHIELQIGKSGIRGVDNMNYVPNHLLFTKMHANADTSNGTAPSSSNSSEETNGSEGPSHRIREPSGGSGRQKRQKNDSGLGSIDSNQFDSQHTSVGPEIQEHSEDFRHGQQPNGYIRHQNISSFS